MGVYKRNGDLSKNNVLKKAFENLSKHVNFFITKSIAPKPLNGFSNFLVIKMSKIEFYK